MRKKPDLVEVASTFSNLERLWLLSVQIGLILFMSLAAPYVAAAGLMTTNENAIKKTISRIAAEQGPYSRDLYPQLNLLAKAQFHNGQYDLARENFLRMQNLVHRQDGVYSTLQFQSIDWLIALYGLTHEFKLVTQLHKYRFTIAEKTFSATSEKMLQPLQIFADSVQANGSYRQSIELYDRAATIIRQHHLPQINMIEVLWSKALSLYLANFCCADQTIVEISQLYANIVDDVDRSLFLTRLADMLLLTGKSADAIHIMNSQKIQLPPVFLGFGRQSDVLDIFVDTSVLMRPAGIEIRWKGPSSATSTAGSVLVGNPVPVCRRGIYHLIKTTPEDLDEYFINVRIEVAETGKVSNVELEGYAPMRLTKYLRNILRKAKYRPGKENNQVAKQTSLSFRQTFNPIEVYSNSQWGLIHNYHACSLLP